MFCLNRKKPLDPREKALMRKTTNPKDPVRTEANEPDRVTKTFQYDMLNFPDALPEEAFIFFQKL